MIFYRNKKAVMSLSIVLLVFATLILLVTSLFVFNFRQKQTSIEFAAQEKIDNLYIREEVLNFYLKQISLDINSKTDPVGQFLSELEKYKEDGKFISSDLIQVERALKENKNNVKIEGDWLKINFTISLVELVYSGFESNSKAYELKKVYDFIYSRKLA